MPDTYSFGAFTLDGDRTLTRQGEPVRLQPQPSLVLALLVERAGSVVTRDELRAALWPDGTHVDFERGINFAVAQVRAALGDSGDDARYVETVPKRGYRFVAPVTTTSAEPPTTPDAGAAVDAWVATPDVSKAGRWTPAAAVALVATFVAVAVIAALAASSGDNRVRVAVVPFDNETADSAYERVAGDIADETVSRLAAGDRLTRLAVIGNAAALRTPRTFRDVRAIGRDVGAEYVVLAQLKRDDTGVRVVAHLIRVKDEVHVWAETFDSADFSLPAQTAIAEGIAQAVERSLAVD